MNSTEANAVPGLMAHCKPVSKNVEYEPPHYEPYGDNLWRVTFGYECKSGYTISTAPESRIITCVEIKSAPQWKDANGDLLEALPECNFSIGVGVGVGVGLPLTIVVLVLIYLYCKERRRRVEREERSKRMSTPLGDGSYGKESRYDTRLPKTPTIGPPSIPRPTSVISTDTYLPPRESFISDAGGITSRRASNTLGHIENSKHKRSTIYDDSDYAVPGSLRLNVEDEEISNDGSDADVSCDDRNYDNNFTLTGRTSDQPVIRSHTHQISPALSKKDVYDSSQRRPSVASESTYDTPKNTTVI